MECRGQGCQPAQDKGTAPRHRNCCWLGSIPFGRLDETHPELKIKHPAVPALGLLQAGMCLCVSVHVLQQEHECSVRERLWVQGSSPGCQHCPCSWLGADSLQLAWDVTHIHTLPQNLHNCHLSVVFSGCQQRVWSHLSPAEMSSFSTRGWGWCVGPLNCSHP